VEAVGVKGERGEEAQRLLKGLEFAARLA